jgi:hypothetical protein
MKNLLNTLKQVDLFKAGLVILAIIPLFLVPFFGAGSLSVSLNLIAGYSKGLFLVCIYSYLYPVMGKFLYKRITLDGLKPENLSIRNINEMGKETGLNISWYRLLNFYLAMYPLAMPAAMARKVFYVAELFGCFYASLLVLQIDSPFFGFRQDIEMLVILITVVLYTQLIIQGFIKTPNVMFSDIQIAINHNQAMLDDQADQEEFARRNALARQEFERRNSIARAQRDEAAHKAQTAFEENKAKARLQRDEEQWRKDNNKDNNHE